MDGNAIYVPFCVSKSVVDKYGCADGEDAESRAEDEVASEFGEGFYLLEKAGRRPWRWRRGQRPFKEEEGGK
jgi:hypothetical protein